MNIVIHAFAQKMREEGKVNPKNYPYWKELIELLQEQGHHIIQVGLDGEEKLVDDFRTLSLKELKELLNTTDIWISVDSFLQHLAWSIGKKGIVLFGPSDPKYFGHKENINLYAGEEYFRPDQFMIWEQCDFNEKAFVQPETVLQNLG